MLVVVVVVCQALLWALVVLVGVLTAALVQQVQQAPHSKVAAVVAEAEATTAAQGVSVVLVEQTAVQVEVEALVQLAAQAVLAAQVPATCGAGKLKP